MEKVKQIPAWVGVPLAWTLLSAVVLGQAVGGTWRGRISDSMCGVKHERIEGMPEMTDKECTLATVRGGSRFVFVLDEKVYQIANQAHPDLVLFAGDHVKVTGQMNGEVVTVSRVELDEQADTKGGAR